MKTYITKKSLRNGTKVLPVGEYHSLSWLKNSIFLFLFISIVISCKKDFFQLDRPPQSPWSTLKEFEKSPIGLYYVLFSGDKWNVTWVNSWIVKNSLADDIGWVNDASYGYWRKSKEFNTYTDKNFLNLYRVIGGANWALDFVDTKKGNLFPEITEQDSINNLNRIIGEIHFCRAYAYYLLETTYGHAFVPGGANDSKDIPMPVHFANTTTEAKNPVIGTTKQVWDLIQSDFAIARQLLPEKYINGVMHPSYEVRASKFAASAMLMRTYFQRGEYDKALVECNYIIDQNKGAYDLTEAPIEAYNKSTLSRGNEVIFYAPYYDISLAVKGPNHLSVGNNTYENNGKCNWVESHMTSLVVKRLGWMNDPLNDTTINIAARSDKRFQQLMTVRYPENKQRPGSFFETRNETKNISTVWCWKYYRGSGLWNTNIPLIRLAEVYLTRSIIRYNSSDKPGAADDLNVVRKRAWDVSVGGAFVPITPNDITADIIGDERIVEMFGEADRIDYLRGLKVDVPPGERATERGYTTVPYTSEDFVWSIPQRELIYDISLQ